MPGKEILIRDYLARKNAELQPPYDEAEARAAERAMEEFDRIAAGLDEETIEQYLLGTLDSKHTG